MHRPSFVALTLLTVLTVILAACAQPKATPELPDQVLVHAERVFGSVTAAELEYQRLFSETKYPNDAEKKKVSEWFTEREAVFELIRVSYRAGLGDRIAGMAD